MDTREQIMAAARKMVQARGYNALSFRDIAASVGVKSASVHYHFPTKGDLGAELARRYTADGVAYLDELLASAADWRAILRLYTGIFRAALVDGNRMCLCGIMSAEHEDLPPEVRQEVDAFTEANLAWLARLLETRRPDTGSAEAQQRAMAIFAAVEGAQLVARGRGDPAAFDTILAGYEAAGLFS
jgi:TetR/AcrR family transcriptional repressor of nem operon